MNLILIENNKRFLRHKSSTFKVKKQKLVDCDVISKKQQMRVHLFTRQTCTVAIFALLQTNLKRGLQQSAFLPTSLSAVRGFCSCA